MHADYSEDREQHEEAHPHEGGHEHPNVYLGPLLEPVGRLLIEETVEKVLEGSDPEDLQPLAALDRGAKELEALAGLSRRIVAGDTKAVFLFQSWLEDARPEMDHEPAEHDRGGDGHHEHHAEHPEHPEEGLADGPEATMPDYPAASALVNPPALIDASIGAALLAGPDRKALDRNLRAVMTKVGEVTRTFEVVYTLAVDLRRGLTDGDELLLTLLDLKKGLPSLLRQPSDAEICLGELHQVLSSPSSAVPMTQQVIAPDPNTERIDTADPAALCMPGTVRLRVKQGQSFDVPPPAGIGVFLAPRGGAGAIDDWQATHVDIRLSQANGSGRVYFSTDPTGGQAAEEVMQSAHGDLAGLRASCPRFFGGGGSMLGGWYAKLPTGPFGGQAGGFNLPLPGAPKLGPQIDVLRPPRLSFNYTDSSGRPIQRLIEAGETVHLRWNVEPGAQTELQVTGQQTIHGLPSTGYLPVVVRGPVTATLRATNACGPTAESVTLRPVFRITPQPTRISLRLGAMRLITLRAGAPVERDVPVTIQNSDPSRVAAPAAVTIPAGATTTTFSVEAREAADEGVAASVLQFSAPGFEPIDGVGVWVEPPGGRWRMAVFPPSGPGQPRVSTIAVHMALLRTGKVLLFAYDERIWFEENKGESAVWDPAAGTITTPRLTRNLFCSHHALLADGRLLVAGGQSLSQTPDQVIWGTLGAPWGGKGADWDVHSFDPGTEAWTRHPDMRSGARWYPTCTTLPDGRVLIVAGFWSQRHVIVNEDFEIWDPAAQDITSRGRFLTGIGVFPFVHVLPDNHLFVHARSMTTMFRPDGSAGAAPLGWSIRQRFSTQTSGTRTYPGGGSSVLLPIGPGDTGARVLVVGGSSAPESGVNEHTPATTSAEIFDWRPGSAGRTGWRPTASLSRRRFMADAVLLPDETVIVVGGVGRGTSDNCSEPVLEPELFDPSSVAGEAWRTLDPMTIPRYYHQTALLLPDGRVAVAGSTGPVFNPITIGLLGGAGGNRYEIETISPPYLFRGPRPELTWAPPRVGYGASFAVGVAEPERVSRITLVRVSSATHQLNTDQRCLRLAELGRGEGTITVEAPPGGGHAPPGYYMLFAISDFGVPSHARFVRIP